MRQLWIVLLILPLWSQAQFMGGIGRGDVGISFQNTLFTPGFYLGGVGRGDAAATFQNSLFTPGFYLGGNGRGDAAALFQNTFFTPGFYLGGVGRGDAAATFQNSLFTPGFYLGGNGRGDAAALFQNTLFTPGFYLGGVGRGDAAATFQNSLFAPGFYLGGNGRGDAAALFQNTLFTPGFYLGGNGRGDAAALFQNTLFTPGFYLGGVGRGDAAAAFQNSLFTPGFYLGGNGRGDAAAIFQNTLFTPGFYLGGVGRGDVAALWQPNGTDDADGDGVVDASDLCPGTPTGEAVNTEGCACSQLTTVDDGEPCTLDECNAGAVTHTFQDGDVDGVCDANDTCPGTTGGELVNAQGCDCGVYPLDDGSECTMDYCYAGVVTHTLVDDNNNGICDLLETGDAWIPTQEFVDGRAGAVSFTIGDTAYMGTGFNGAYLNDFYARDPVTGTWLPRENVPGPGRQGAVAFTLNGKGYVGTGSFDDPNPELALADFHEYDPATGHWTTIEVFPFPVKYATAFSIGGKGYVATGISGTDKLTTLLSYEPGTGWISSVSLPGVGRAYASSFVIGDKAYVYGGAWDSGGMLNELWSFDETNGWQSLTSGGISEGRGLAMAFTIGNGGFIVGGMNSSNTPLGETWEYNPFTNEWYARAPLVGGPRHYGTSFTLGQTAYVGTGYVGGARVSSFEQYTPPPPDCQGVPGGNAIPGSSCDDGIPATVNDAWTSSCDCEGHVPSDEWLYRGTAASNARYGAVSFTIGDVAYFGGGADANGALFDFHRYDPVNGWAAIDPIPGGPRIYAVAFSSGGKGYVGTGSDNNFYEYDPATGWHQLDNPLPGPVRAYATAFTISDEGYVGLGQTVGPVTYLRDFYKFVPGQDPGSGVWEPIEHLFPAHQAWLNGEFYDTGIAFATGFSVGGNGYVCCGAFDNTNNEFFQPLNELWAYTPGIGWVAKAPLPVSNRLLATGFSIGDKGYVGTGLSYPFGLNYDFYEYDPVADVWTQRATYSGGQRQYASGFSISGKGYIVGGSNNSPDLPNDLWEYAPPVTCISGTACDDGDPCTDGDIFDANCNCAGTTSPDTDNDGLCDAMDPCPLLASLVNGNACDDGNACTINDVVADCACAGTLQDNDADGVCDTDDVCPGTASGAAVSATGCACAQLPTVCFDDACAAGPLVVGVNGPYSNVGASVQAGEPQPPVGPCTSQLGWCGGQAPSHSVWFSFVAPPSGKISLNFGTTNTWDSQIAIWSAPDCNALHTGGATLVAANDDFVAAFPYYAAIAPVCVTAGATYYVQVDGYSSNTFDHFQLVLVEEVTQNCDDGIACTVDTYDCSTGQCVHVLQDVDGDGICDANDSCPNVAGQIGSSCDDGNANTSNDVLNASCVCAGTTMAVQVAAKVILEGPYNGTTGLMGDNLRTLSSFALAEPYTALGYAHSGGGGGESISAGVLAVTGNDAIVDWVLLELRSTADPATILASRSALVQRDGDVVDVDGTSPVSFSIAPGNFHVVARHRNHLGCMTAGPVSLSASPASVDFTATATTTYGTNARKTSSGAVSVQMLWAGDVSFDGQSKYTGAGNDRDPILARIGGTVPTNTVFGYHSEDVNMDGTVKYTGADNDRDPVLLNIGGSVPTNVHNAQLP